MEGLGLGLDWRDENHPSFDKRPDSGRTLILNGLFGPVLHALPSLPMLDSLKDSDVLAPFRSAAFVSDRELRLSARASVQCGSADSASVHRQAEDEHTRQLPTVSIGHGLQTGSRLQHGRFGARPNV